MQHETIFADALEAGDAYRLMTDIVAPRPIAWVSTQSGAGHRNLAPFSYYQAMCSRPPTIALGFGWTGDGRPKDSLRNILETRELCVCHVSRPLADAMNATAAMHPAEVSEWEVVGVESTPSRKIRPPRVADAGAALECRLTHAIPLGRTPAGSPSSTVVLAEVLAFHIREDWLRRDDRGRLLPIAPANLASVGRLGGIAYTATDGVFELPRPPAPQPPTKDPS